MHYIQDSVMRFPAIARSQMPSANRASACDCRLRCRYRVRMYKFYLLPSFFHLAVFDFLRDYLYASESVFACFVGFPFLFFSFSYKLSPLHDHISFSAFVSSFILRNLLLLLMIVFVLIQKREGSNVRQILISKGK